MEKVGKILNFERLEDLVAGDRRGYFTIIALLAVLGMLINSITLFSFAVEIPMVLVYFVINTIFCGSILFREEPLQFRMVFGLLALLMLTALGGAAVIISSSLLPVRLDMKTVLGILGTITVLLSVIKHTRLNVWINQGVEDKSSV
ncbi:MAG: hypothetical protein JSV58_06860 [Candidatus Bathyarchaeota archaeon]|nr:MAG: hypothetical protein JSV58_06860 [Candidatus Bathyarchaeota archaeon]